MTGYQLIDGKFWKLQPTHIPLDTDLIKSGLNSNKASGSDLSNGSEPDDRATKKAVDLNKADDAAAGLTAKERHKTLLYKAEEAFRRGL